MRYSRLPERRGDPGIHSLRCLLPEASMCPMCTVALTAHHLPDLSRAKLFVCSGPAPFGLQGGTNWLPGHSGEWKRGEPRARPPSGVDTEA